jgi:hypothetical protein
MNVKKRYSAVETKFYGHSQTESRSGEHSSELRTPNTSRHAVSFCYQERKGIDVSLSR